MKSYLTTVFGLFILILISSCHKDDKKLPSLTTTEITQITDTSAYCGGSVIKDGDDIIKERGVCWSSGVLEPSIYDNKTIDGTGQGVFTSLLLDLIPNTTYYVRAYATNSVGTAYGNIKLFKTNESLPTVTTSSISLITQTSVQCGGTIASEGNILITARGVCCGIEPLPEITGDKTIDGTGYGIFISNIEGLLANTTYYVRAYATNSQGITAYGEDSVFKTKADLPNITTAQVSKITSTTVQCGGNILSDHGIPIVSRGVCWGSEKLPTLSDNITADGIGSGEFISNISGLSAKSTYYIRAYATNSESSTAYGDEQTFTTLPESIVYPGRGLYGVNLLSLDTSEVVQISNGSYSINALLPEPRKLTITIQFFTISTFQGEERIGWDFKWLNSATNLLELFDDGRSDELDMRMILLNHGTAKISVYEDDQEVPNKIIQVSW